MYKKFYGLSEKPFNIVPNPAYLYRSEKHQDALTYLEYGLMEGTGFILLTGEIGTGKTTLIRYMLNNVESDMDVAVIFNTNITSDQLITLVLDNFEIQPKKDKTANLDLLYQFLIQKFSDERRVLLIIDEAQNLSPDVLEEVRMLSNLQSDEQILLQIMLVGQPELKTKLQAPGLAQLAQRITVNYHLSRLTGEETKEYIAYRLEKAGGSSDIFISEAVDLIFESSGGIPRIINMLCDSAMVYGFGYELKRIDRKVIVQVLEDKGEIGFYTGQEEKRNVGVTAETNEGLDIGDISERLQRLEVNLQDIRLKVNLLVKKQTASEDGYHDELVNTLQNLLVTERENNDKHLQKYTALDARFKQLFSNHSTLIKNREQEEQNKTSGIKKWFTGR